MEELSQGIDEVFARVDVDGVHAEDGEQMVAFLGQLLGSLSIQPAMAAARCVERDDAAGFGVAQFDQTHVGDLELAPVGHDDWNHIVSASGHFQGPFVTAVLKVADEKHHRTTLDRFVQVFDRSRQVRPSANRLAV